MELGEDVAPAIVTEQEFAAIESQLARNRATSTRHNSDPEATLLRCGIGRCGYCGYPLQITRRKNKPHMYRCHPVGRERHECPSFGVMAYILDPIVWREVENVLLNPEIIAKEVERRRDSDPFAVDLESLERRQQTIESQQKRLSRAVAIMEDEEASAPLLTELRQLGVEAKALRFEQNQLRGRAQNRDADTEALNSITSWCQRVSKNIPTLTYQEKRLIMDALGLSVRVFRADHEPRWEIRMAPLPLEASEESPFVFSNPRSTEHNQSALAVFTVPTRAN